MTKIQAPITWLVRALVELAKRELAERNKTCGDCWPAGQEWDELGPSSQHAFMHAAREAAGIPHEQYRELIALACMGPDGESLDALWSELNKPLERAAQAPAAAPLTDEQIEQIRALDDCGEDAPEFARIVRLAERAHGITDQPQPQA